MRIQVRYAGRGVWRYELFDEDGSVIEAGEGSTYTLAIRAARLAKIDHEQRGRLSLAYP